VAALGQGELGLASEEAVKLGVDSGLGIEGREDLLVVSETGISKKEKTPNNLND
jgi:hypothetical protein